MLSMKIDAPRTKEEAFEYLKKRANSIIEKSKRDAQKARDFLCSFEESPAR